MQVDYPYIPLIRINAPEIFADTDFKQWFFHRPKGCDTAEYGPAIATWHQPQKAEFGEYSDFFTTVEGVADGDEAAGDGSESDMPQRIWKNLVTAAWKSLKRPARFACLLWVSNLRDRRRSPMPASGIIHNLTEQQSLGRKDVLDLLTPCIDNPCDDEALDASLTHQPHAENVWQPDSHWESHPQFTAADWRAEAFVDNTRLGYVGWVNAQLDEQQHE